MNKEAVSVYIIYSHVMDSKFPATSIGRTTGSKINLNRTSSQDSLGAHPLLFEQKYVPYAPRQPRPSPRNLVTALPASAGDTAATTAALENIGLPHDSVGYAILEGLRLASLEYRTNHGQGANGKWTDIWESVTTGHVGIILCYDGSFTV